MHPSLQHAVLSVLQASLDSTLGAAGAVHATAEQLASLLQLLQLSRASSALWELAYGAAQSYLQQTVGFDNPAEVHLWLDSLAATSNPARYALQGVAEGQGHCCKGSPAPPAWYSFGGLIWHFRSYTV